jgi:DNA-binding transcriptional LysR family regulator
MNYQALLYFKAVAELQHYTNAADALFITQPALSKAIHNLESELGTPLFHKDGRNVSLTKCGALFYEHVKRSIAEIDEGVAAVKRLVDIEHNTVFLSAIFSTYAIYLPDKILKFRRQHPECRFSMEFKYTTAILEDIVHKRSELGICSDFKKVGDYATLDSASLYREPLCLIVGRDHRLARHEKVKVEELRNERFIIFIRSNVGTNGILSELCARHGFEPNFAAEAYNDYGVIGMVSAGDGIALLPNTGFLNTTSIVQLPLDIDTPLYRTIHLVWNKEARLSPMAALFRDALQDSADAPKSTRS